MFREAVKRKELRTMGGWHGEVRGKTKLACWKEFEEVRRNADDSYEWDVMPKTKHEAYHMMKKDEEKEEWVLWYHFGK